MESIPKLLDKIIVSFNHDLHNVSNHVYRIQRFLHKNEELTIPERPMRKTPVFAAHADVIFTTVVQYFVVMTEPKQQKRCLIGLAYSAFCRLLLYSVHLLDVFKKPHL